VIHLHEIEPFVQRVEQFRTWSRQSLLFVAPRQMHNRIFRDNSLRNRKKNVVAVAGHKQYFCGFSIQLITGREFALQFAHKAFGGEGFDPRAEQAEFGLDDRRAGGRQTLRNSAGFSRGDYSVLAGSLARL
jgi:hypothetical protein